MLLEPTIYDTADKYKAKDNANNQSGDRPGLLLCLKNEERGFLTWALRRGILSNIVFQNQTPKGE
jgi:hypothetical protein